MPAGRRQRLRHQAHRHRKTAVAAAHLDAGTAGSAVLRLEISDAEVRQLLETLYQRYHYDFRQYAAASLKRRLQQAISHFHCDSLARLEQLILTDSSAFPRLLEYLTVQVSDLFRDPEFFLALRRQVTPLLATYPSLKLWIAGCSTGEEAYSFAILLAEE